MTKLEALIRAHQPPGAAPISYAHAEELLRQAKFDGPVTVHWRGGVPRRIELGKPLTVDLAPPASGGVTPP